MAFPIPQPAATDADLLPIVDEHDQLLGVLPRRVVHLGAHRHRAVHVCVFDAAGRLYLQRRGLSKDTFPGWWDLSCTGHVDPGETYGGAAVRELREELGIATSEETLQFLFKHDACERSGWEFQAVYSLVWPAAIEFNRAEIETMRACDAGDIRRALQTPRADFALAPSIGMAWPELEKIMARALAAKPPADFPKAGNE